MADAIARPFGLLGVLAGLVGTLLLASPLLVVGVTPYLIGVVLAGTLLLVVAARRRSAGRADDPAPTVWSAIPSWQYAGRHVESGGLSREDQERAIADLQEQAAEYEER